MMLPKEIKDVRFSRAFKGYSDREVDEFLNRVLEDYGQLYRDNAELEHKIEILADKIREYRNAEQTLEETKKKVLRLAQEKVSEARDEASRIEREAKEKAERILIEAKRDAERERRNYERLQLEVTRFKNKAINLFKTEIDQLNNLPSLQVSPQEMMRIQTESMMEEQAPQSKEQSSDYAVEYLRKATAEAPSYDRQKPTPIQSIEEELPQTPNDVDIFGNSINLDEEPQSEKVAEDIRSHAFTLNVKPKEENQDVPPIMPLEDAVKPEALKEVAEEPLTMSPVGIEKTDKVMVEEEISEITDGDLIQDIQSERVKDEPKFIKVENSEIDSVLHRSYAEEEKKQLPLAEEEDVRPMQGETGNFEIIDTNGTSLPKEPTQVKEEHPRFGQLRFGDDYDLETDDFSSGGGLFKRKKKKKD